MAGIGQRVAAAVSQHVRVNWERHLQMMFSRLELLLADIRDAFADKVDVSSADLVKALVAIEGRPWAEMGKRGNPMTQKMLAWMLKSVEHNAPRCSKSWRHELARARAGSLRAGCRQAIYTNRCPR